MRPISLYCIFAILTSFFFGATAFGQTFGATSSAIWLSNCTQSNYYNTTGTDIAPPGNAFTNTNFGAHTQNSGTLVLRGAQVRTFKDPATANVCNVRMYYRTYLQTGTPGAFSMMELPLTDNCNTGTSQFPSGGSCQPGGQKWDRVIAAGVTSPYAPVNLTSLPAGNYVLEVYYDVTGSSSSTTLCNETIQLNNGGNNYKAFFSIQAPTLSTTNPSTCNGSEGSIIINGLVAGVTYAVEYTDDGVLVGPVNFVAYGSGQVIISGLNAGVYYDISITANGCRTEFSTDLTLSTFVIVPKFNAIAPFCAGATAPALQATSNNGITGSWSPAIINNQASGSYTFTPDAGQCSRAVTINVTVNPNVTPAFTFGTSLSICAGGTVPSLPSTSNNGITGTWSPATVDNMASGTYTFTPNAGQCAIPTSFTVTVTPNITPVFSFGTSLTICAGGNVPTLPTTSTNDVNGTWSPSVVSNQASGSYTFTPASGLCALPITFTVTVNPNITPAFSFGNALTICSGESVPSLATTSANGITGTWSPAIVDNLASATYTFTPDAGQCATTTTFTVTVNANVTPAFSFGTSLTLCENGTTPSLATTSTNGITGTWSPAVVDNQTSGTYTFTPDAGQCAVTATFNVTVNPNVTPDFSFGTSLTICAGGTAPALPATSTNGISGSWSPAVIDNQTSGIYTFTPGAGQCATTTSLNVTVSATITPSFNFGTSLTICAGGNVPTLPTTSVNGITGSWSPAIVNDMASGTYTFTPDAGQCATAATYTVTVTPISTPDFSFGTSLSICTNGTVPSLPATSVNGITGTWSPAIVDNMASATYTFTPDAGQCATTTTFTVTVNPIITPAFSFGTSLSICAGGNVPTLPTTSGNGISGTWSPSVVNNQASGTYTFTPAAGQCAPAITFTVTVTPYQTPVFSFGTSLTICAGDNVPVLAATSSNGITGSWSPAIIDNQTSGVYTFTPDVTPGQCINKVTFTITVNQKAVPEFSIGTSLTICTGGNVPTLPATSANGFSGSWSSAVVDNQASASYIFTPDAGQCAVATTFNVTVNPNVAPSFSFGTSLTICAGGSVPTLSTTSANGITGRWSPAVVGNQTSGTYTFTPDAGQCALPATFNVTVKPNQIPAFDFGTAVTICAGDNMSVLPTISTNGFTGTWSPAVINNMASGTYTFTPDAVPGECINSVTFTVTVNQKVVPVFSFGATQTICAGSTVPTLPATSVNGITGTWSPAVVDNQVSRVYTFSTTAGQCAEPSATFTVTINPVPAFTQVKTDTTVNDGAIIPSFTPSAIPAGTSFTWTNSNTGIGLAASGSGTVPSFTAINRGTAPVSTTVLVTPTLNGCAGTPLRYVINVTPLNKDIFVPNVFSPNGDRKNDVLYVYGNYIDKLEMRIFNQWGEQVEVINSRTKGWDGKFKGKDQPVGVYVYVLEAVMTDGRKVTAKGNITLLR